MATDGEIIKLEVTGPPERLIQAFYALLGDRETAVIEMYLPLSAYIWYRSARVDPRIITSYGTGELVLAHGVKAMVLDIGGSAIKDIDTGMI